VQLIEHNIYVRNDMNFYKYITADVFFCGNFGGVSSSGTEVAKHSKKYMILMIK